MRQYWQGIVLMVLICCMAGCQGGEASPTVPASTVVPPTVAPPTVARPTATPVPTREAPARPLLLAHTMPWYQAPPINTDWGWHWTMNHFKPDQKDANGRPDIASHFTPLTGPYDSRDPALLEYQVALMKVSGIDGVIVDWYGIENFWDYGILNTSTQKLFEWVKKSGLLFSICYEDQTIKNMVDNKHMGTMDIYTHGQAVMSYLQTTWFGDDAYLHTGGKPVLFIFGPQYFKSGTDWTKLFSVLDPQPAFITLDYRVESVATAGYPWPPMSASQNGVLSQSALESYLTQFYAKAAQRNYIVAGAFPGFYDIYKEAGVSEGYGFLDAQEGQTFSRTLQLALDQRPDVIQLITWNDYGEGTNIEPTEEYGYRYLTIVQDVRRATDAQFTYTADDLELPLRLFQARKQYAKDTDANARLDEAFIAIIAGQTDVAADILADYP